MAPRPRIPAERKAANKPPWTMTNQFFEKPILNSPYGYPVLHWELDKTGQPTQQIIDKRRPAEFITPIPKPKKQKGSQQESLLFDETLSTQAQQYHSAIINSVRTEVDKWRALKNPNDWRVTPETARLLQHWRHHEFSGVRPFFCQVEAVETAIWLTEVAPQIGKAGQVFMDHLDSANNDANPELMRLALKLATGAGKTTVMAMLIAWQTVNAVRRPNSKKFTRGLFAGGARPDHQRPPSCLATQREQQHRPQCRLCRPAAAGHV